MAGDVFAVASGKGGVGKTTTVVNLGVVLRRANHSVALVDADLGMANLGTILGVDGEHTVHDVLSGDVSLEEALVEEAPGFAVLAGSRDLAEYPDADPKGLRDIVALLAEDYDVVLVDTGAGISYEDVLPLGLVDGVILVTTPDPAAVADTAKTAELTALAEGGLQGVVVTHATPTTDATHVASEVGVDLLGVVPLDAAVRESTAAGRPLEAMAPESPAAEAYRELAEALLETDVEKRVQSAAAVGGLLADDGSGEGEEAEEGSAEPADGADEAGATDGGSGEAAAEVAPADAEAADPGSGDADAATEPPDEAAVEAEPAAPDDAAADEPTEPDDAAEDAPGADAGDGDADDAAADDDDEDLEDFEDLEADEGGDGGFFSRLGRLFR